MTQLFTETRQKRMPNSEFKCSNPNCNNSIACDGLNRVKLKVLRRLARDCSKCNKKTMWIEQTILPNIQIQQKANENGGSQNAKNYQHNY